MEKALLGDQIIYASDIKKDWEYERTIRECSSKGLLRCPDEHCDSSLLKYCHGNKKRPYFAHRYTSECAYDKYDKQNATDVNYIKNLLYSHLLEKGSKVDVDVKVSEHQYSHIVIYEDGKRFAIELVKDTATTRKISKTIYQYKDIDILVSFVVIGSDFDFQNESEANFIRRYSLNESVNNELLVINKEGTEVYQYKLDDFEYTYFGNNIFEFKNLYSEKKLIEDLVFENSRLTLKGFDRRYDLWVEEKQKKYRAFLIPKEAKKDVDCDETSVFAPAIKVNNRDKKDVVDTSGVLSLKTDKKASDSENEKETFPVFDASIPRKISELSYIKNISLPYGKGPVGLIKWDEEDFIEKIQNVCYQRDEIAFKHLITKFLTASKIEQEIINKLWLEFKNKREDYFYILKVAHTKSQE